MSIQPDPFVTPAQPVEAGLDAYGRPVVAHPVEPVLPVQHVVVDPVPAPQVVVEPVPVQRVVVQQPAVRRQVATSYGQRFAPDSVVVAIVGLVLMIAGLVAVARAGTDGPMSTPVVKVFGFTHTATLGFIEIAIGLCLLICAAATTRSGAIFFGLILGVGGIVGAVQTKSFHKTLALQSSLAWLMVVAAVVVVLVSLLMPRVATRTTRLESI
jgi:uncharacterized membrane protein HdeD (DUF308 family)